MIIAKQKESNSYFELFEPMTMTDINEKEVKVLKSIGHYSLAQLETQKTQYAEEIIKIDEKISAINKLSK